MFQNLTFLDLVLLIVLSFHLPKTLKDKNSMMTWAKKPNFHNMLLIIELMQKKQPPKKFREYTTKFEGFIAKIVRCFFFDKNTLMSFDGRLHRVVVS